MPTSSLIPIEHIERTIIVLRGHNVMLDSDLAILYGVSTKVLNQAVKRNINRFPGDSMFRLTPDEAAALGSQFVTPNKGRGGRRTLPYAFTEEGVAMLSSVLSSDRAIKVNIAIMRAFVRLRQVFISQKELARTLDEIDRKLGEHDHNFELVFQAIQQLMQPPVPRKRRRIGFRLK